jgi:hypothetical protein
LFFRFPRPILPGLGYQIAPTAHYVAVSFVINSTFPALGEEIESKSGPL